MKTKAVQSFENAEKKVKMGDAWKWRGITRYVHVQQIIVTLIVLLKAAKMGAQLRDKWLDCFPQQKHAVLIVSRQKGAQEKAIKNQLEMME